MGVFRRTSNSGVFAVQRDNHGLIRLFHEPSGLPAGVFSHLRVKSLKAAIEGVNEAEKRMRPGEMGILAASIKNDRASHEAAGDALAGWEAEMRRSFPNGAWSR